MIKAIQQDKTSSTKNKKASSCVKVYEIFDNDIITCNLNDEMRLDIYPKTAYSYVIIVADEILCIGIYSISYSDCVGKWGVCKSM